ncbi:MAG: sigma-70 family RNA polymerase sigma factor [Planctomycetales bacterium]|nr:sigma-70 family RNA polymerase sigma factor [Planctomycetales bacterium]
MSAREEQFAQSFSTHQQRLLGYVLGLVRNSADAQDILQQTAVTAWRKFDEFDSRTDFFRWSATIARYETLNFLRYRRRSRLCFDQSLMETLEQDACEFDHDEAESRLRALGECLKKLPVGDSKLIECRYAHGLSSLQIADILDRTQPSICNSLRRIRETLMRCINRNLATAREV